jgi:hypothetical protein
MVKNSFLIKSTFMAMLLSPFVAQATSDEYPAADFQPKVLYSDSDYKHTESAPAASGASKTEFDPNYPAAAFEPKVLYKDSSYQHKADKVTASPRTSSASSSSSASSENGEASSAKSEDSDQTMLIGVVVLAVLGFFFYRKNAGTAAPKSRATSRPAPRAAVATADVAEGATRVERYLAKKQPKTTRVAMYLQQKEKSLPSTGVAKYLAKQVVRSRKLAEEKATGVEKYLRKKKG